MNESRNIQILPGNSVGIKIALQMDYGKLFK